MASGIAASLLIGGALFPLFCLAAPAPPELPESVEFAKTHIGDFDVVAQTLTDGTVEQPYVRDVTCVAQSGVFRLWSDRMDRVEINISGNFVAEPSDESIQDLSFSDAVWLGVGSHRYELGGVLVHPNDNQFADVQYAPRPEGDIDVGSMIEYWGFRRSPDDSWLAINLLVPEIMDARVITLGYRKRGAEDTGRAQLRTATLHVAGIRDVLKWCQAEVRSKAAYRFHQAG